MPECSSARSSLTCRGSCSPDPASHVGFLAADEPLHCLWWSQMSCTLPCGRRSKSIVLVALMGKLQLGVWRGDLRHPAGEPSLMM